MTRPAPHRLVVDRFEGDWVVVEAEDGAMLDLPRWMFPGALREGDVLVASAGPGGEGEWRVTLRVDPDATREARASAEAILGRLRRRDPGGDIEL